MVLFSSKRLNPSVIKVLMKLLITLLLVGLSSLSLAQQICPVSAQEVAVFFGNGIDTTQKEAERSRDALRKQLGDTYNGKTLTYTLAYNKTDGFSADLIQSAAQAGIQFDSQLSAWLYGLSIAPDWFNQGYQSWLLAQSQIAAEELTSHVAAYQEALQLGKKVMVISHSQGNYYVNAAKKLLEAIQPALPMTAFGIFGVATPANNVGGDSQPYYTNNRDVILAVPGSLPTNWALKNAAGEAVGLINPLKAHGFEDTYMSGDYDLRPALVAGIKQRMSTLTSLVKPITCSDDVYRKHFLSLVAGSYTSLCNFQSTLSALTIDSQAKFSALGQTVDASGVESYVTLTQSFTTGSISASDASAVVNWVQSGLYAFGGLSTPGVASVSCRGNGIDPLVPVSYIPNKLDITNDVLGLLADKRRLFPKSTCFSSDPFAPVVSNVPVYFTGSVLTYGDKSLDLKATNRATEGVVILPGATATLGGSSPDYEPQFRYNVTFQDNTAFQVLYKLSSGITYFGVTGATNQALSCYLP